MAKAKSKKKNRKEGKTMTSPTLPTLTGQASTYVTTRRVHELQATPVATVDKLEPLVPDDWGLYYVPGVATTLGKTSFFLGVNRIPEPLPEASIVTVAKLVEHKDAKEASILAIMPDNPKLVNEFTDSEEDELRLAYQGIVRKTVYSTGGNTLVLKAKSDVAVGLPAEQEGIEFTLKQKIPHELLKAAIAYAKYIYSVHRTEFAWQIYRDKAEGKYMLYIPGQIIETAHVNYQEDVNARQTIRNNGYDLVLEGHSHGAMGAFFSGGDNANEKQPCTYIVLAGFNSDRCTSIARVKVVDYEAPLALTDIFDLPEGRDIEWLLNSTDIPAVCPEIVKMAAKTNYVATSTPVGYGAYSTYHKRTNVVDFPNHRGHGTVAGDRYRNLYSDYYDDGFSHGYTELDYDNMTDSEWLRLYGADPGPAEPKGLHAGSGNAATNAYKNNHGISKSSSLTINLQKLASMPASEYNDDESKVTTTMEYKELNNLRVALGQAKQLELIGALAKRASVTLKAFLDLDGTPEGDIINAEDLARSMSEREVIKTLRYLLNNTDSGFYSRK